MLKLKTLILIILCINSALLYSQDVEFSQFYANKIHLNPAFAGSDINSRLSLSYRNQWPEINSAYITYSAAYDQFVDVLHGGIGVQVLQDEQGDGFIKTSMVGGIYSYSMFISKKIMLRAGFQVSLVERKLDYRNFVLPDQTDDFYINGLINPFSNGSMSGYHNNNFIDFSSGLILSGEEWFIGFASHHLSQPEQPYVDESDFSKLPRKYTLHCGINIPVFRRGLRTSEYSISPNFLYQKQGVYRHVNLGMYFSRKVWMVGVWYKDNLNKEFDAIILQAGIFKNSWQVSYSYDKTISKLIHTNTGAHELSFLVRFKNTNRNKRTCKKHYFLRKKRMGSIKCPKF